jgi:oligopeptide/dipeptide ABC transporter ATP-binding protein
MSAPLIRFDNVTKVYGSLRTENHTVALDQVSLTIDSENPQIIAVVGESGSGKTTLSSLLLGFIRPTTGTVFYQGTSLREVRGKDMQKFRREVQAVFQDPFAVFNPFYKVDHVLQIPISKFNLASGGARRHELMVRALEAVGLRPDETLGRYPHQLSGGQRQRIIVARALMLQPKLIIADEPVSMVDASLRATILESLRRVNREIRVPIVYITHDLGTAYHLADHIVVMYRGRIVEAGEAETVITDPQHPYTRLLIDSIPWPDPGRAWGQSHERAEEDAVFVDVPPGHPGCRFADRCVRVMPQCVTNPPPMLMVGDQHAAACLLHEGNDELPNQDVSPLIALSDSMRAERSA